MEQLKKLKVVRKFGNWVVWSLCRPRSLKTVARGQTKCRLDVLGVQDVRRGEGDSVSAGVFTLFYGNDANG